MPDMPGRLMSIKTTSGACARDARQRRFAIGIRPEATEALGALDQFGQFLAHPRVVFDNGNVDWHRHRILPKSGRGSHPTKVGMGMGSEAMEFEPTHSAFPPHSKGDGHRDARALPGWLTKLELPADALQALAHVSQAAPPGRGVAGSKPTPLSAMKIWNRPGSAA